MEMHAEGLAFLPGPEAAFVCLDRRAQPGAIPQIEAIAAGEAFAFGETRGIACFPALSSARLALIRILHSVSKFLIEASVQIP
jgi:hypothetical protein